MPAVHLDDRALIDVAGPDAAHFLQNILTCDLDALGEDEAMPGALLSPQGKILFDFLISRSGSEHFVLDCLADSAEAFARRLILYRLRANVDISQREQGIVTVTWESDSIPSRTDSSGSALRDTRFSEQQVMRVYGDGAVAAAPLEEWTRLRIRHGVAEGGSDFPLGDAFPHDVLLDQMSGVGFRKGCYIGQEVVSRMQHRGTARRRVLIAHGETELPSPGTELRAGGKPVGTLGSVVGKEGLAIARIDKIKQAMDTGEDIYAGDVTLRLSIPRWATFRFPDDAPSEDA